MINLFLVLISIGLIIYIFNCSSDWCQKYFMSWWTIGSSTIITLFGIFILLDIPAEEYSKMTGNLALIYSLILAFVYVFPIGWWLGYKTDWSQFSVKSELISSAIFYVIWTLSYYASISVIASKLGLSYEHNYLVSIYSIAFGVLLMILFRFLASLLGTSQNKFIAYFTLPAVTGIANPHLNMTLLSYF